MNNIIHEQFSKLTTYILLLLLFISSNRITIKI